MVSTRRKEEIGRYGRIDQEVCFHDEEADESPTMVDVLAKHVEVVVDAAVSKKISISIFGFSGIQLRTLTLIVVSVSGVFHNSR